ncbi:hypothetical protein UFOVP591_35 [uncultured Caudovirales phage]|jgi:hypothetical protein|uniref:Lipoprotein n=1 Tax=uncultured Caudovirales phage TaxID=2100421 RepID=A0A6J5N375_9CAUD|nr:hypothetical protein UFOVP591_35 [uncultured Caudovirales phage]
MEYTKVERYAYMVVGLVAVLLIMGAVTGCAVSSPYSDRGSIAIAADEKGMRAFGDMFNGAITNGKASPDQETAAWQARKQQEVEETKRATAPGILGGLFAKKEGV